MDWLKAKLKEFEGSFTTKKTSFNHASSTQSFQNCHHFQSGDIFVNTRNISMTVLPKTSLKLQNDDNFHENHR